jgi:hypothetical protein
LPHSNCDTAITSNQKFAANCADDFSAEETVVSLLPQSFNNWIAEPIGTASPVWKSVSPNLTKIKGL